jgi:all-trans-retinol 13,14-reductase
VNESEQWDIICVGAGITSLAFAAQIVDRHPGTRILVIDKHLVPGGYATIFRRPKQDVAFDCSLHKLSGMTGEGNLKRIFSSMGLDPELEIVYPGDYFEASFPGKSIRFPNEAKAFKQKILELYPEETTGIEQFFNDVEIHGKNAYFQFQMMAGTYSVDLKTLIKELRFAHKHLKDITVSQAFERMFASMKLRSILAVPCGYVGGYPEDLGYLYFLHIVYATLHCGNAYVRGASQKLSDLLAQRIHDAGGKVILRTRVERICTDAQGRATGVVTNKGEFRAAQVYVNTSPHYAIENFFDSTINFTTVREKLADLKPSWSTTTLYVVTDKAPVELGLGSTETFLFDVLVGDAEESRKKAIEEPSQALCEKAYWSYSPIEITDYHALNPDGGMVIILNVLDRIDHWPERRTPEYKEKKKRATEVLLERLYARYPAFRGRIRYCELSSPRTYLRYTNNTAGAGYGALITTNLSGHVFHYNFPVKGVNFMSAWVAGPSYEAAFGYAEHKAAAWKPEQPVAITQ